MARAGAGLAQLDGPGAPGIERVLLDIRLGRREIARLQHVVEAAERHPTCCSMAAISGGVLRLARAAAAEDGLVTEMDTFDPYRGPGFDLPETLA